MKLKDFLSSVVENKKNGQLTTSLRKNKLKKEGVSKEELLNMDIDIKLKRILEG